VRIGILGSGLMGGKLGTLFARAGHEVVFSYARSQAKLKRLARIAGDNALAGTPAEAAQGADALLLAVHWSRFPDVLQQAGDISGKIIVSCSLPMNAGDSELVVAQTSSGLEELAKIVPKARVVAAFNSVPSEVLFSVYEGRRRAKRPSGDDKRVKAIAATMIRDVGFDPVDAGPHGLSATSSRLRYWSLNSPTRERAAQNWRTGSIGAENRGPERPRRRSSFG
jgi:predicted dinucleotide-binding enzyme